MDKHTDKIKKRYNRTASFFDIMEWFMENESMKEWRRSVWNSSKGKILEVGVGTGTNIEYYPDGADVTAIDFSEKMLEKSKEKALNLNKSVDLKLMDVQKLDFPDEYFDTIITTCVFCSVPDPIKGLKEIRRVCKKDGHIIMLEHVKSKNKVIGFLMELLNPVIARLVGANINRDTISNLRKSGLQIIEEKNLMFDIVKLIKSKTK